MVFCSLCFFFFLPVWGFTSRAFWERYLFLFVAKQSKSVFVAAEDQDEDDVVPTLVAD